MTLKEILKDKLTDEQLKLVPRSFDIIGSREKAVAIVEIPDELVKKEKVVAEAIMQLHKNVKSVLKKASERKGELRLREHVLIAGDVDSEVVHKEYGYTLKLDPQKVYFSPREATERQRIAAQVKENEMILVVGSGIAVLPIAIVKQQSHVKKVFGIEVNGTAHRYAIENVRTNKMSDKIILIKGDVEKVLANLNKMFNRIIIPILFDIPKFLEISIPYLLERGIIHYYFIGTEQDMFSAAVNQIKKIATKFNKKIKVLSKVVVLPYGPKKWKVRIDSYLY